ncbi:MAG: methylated-DNA--[protein]-cysteine S-methyltransferase [Acidimicrobiia bacterium]
MSIEESLADLIGGPAPGRISDATALGTGLADGFDFYESAVGRVVVTFNPAGVSSVTLAEEDYESYFEERFGRPLLRAEAPSAWGKLIPERLEAGSPGKLPVDLRSVTPFQARVLNQAARIPRGEVRPYGWLARKVGNAGAARAVGSTMARNPVPLIIPCHRVVRSDGHIGAYSLGGADRKWKLLTTEGATPASLEQLAGRNVRYLANTSTGIFCHPTCRAIRRSKAENVVELRSAGDATAKGYRPCHLCEPPGGITLPS